jgi:NADH:ubiquinone oxidoreductase subunit 6 (subunit J)
VDGVALRARRNVDVGLVVVGRRALPGLDAVQRPLAFLVGAAIFIELSIAIVASGLLALDSGGPEVALGFGSPASVGKLLLERFLIAFEAASLLLLIAAIGAVVLAERRRRDEPDAEQVEEVPG